MKNILKKAGIMSILLGIAAMLFLFGSSVFAASTPITKAKAKQIALQKAKVEKTAVKKWTKVKLDNWDDDGDKEWDVEFRTSTYKYEVEINSRTGRVEDFEKERLKTSQKLTPAPSASKLTLEEAKKIALKKAGVKSADVTKWTKTKLDGNEWELKFRTAAARYEVEINARTGAVKKFEQKKTAAGSSKTISETEAKNIALNHAKKQANVSGTARYTKVELDRDNGITVYEIDFRFGRLEFEYEINATNGQIISWDMDYDD